MAYFFEAPFTYFRKLTIPSCNKESYSRVLLSLYPIISPIFFIIAIESNKFINPILILLRIRN